MTQHALQSDEALEKAWGHIGRSAWDQMAWFVKLARRPTLEQMREVQELIAPHLNNLADGKDTQTPTIRIHYTVRFRKTDTEEERTGYPRYQVLRGEIGEPTANLYARTLLLRMTRLLEDFADAIRRCPHCHKVFLQLRRNRNYCGKPCYTVAVMQRLRA